MPWGAIAEVVWPFALVLGIFGFMGLLIRAGSRELKDSGKQEAENTAHREAEKLHDLAAEAKLRRLAYLKRRLDRMRKDGRFTPPED
jgi:hypothetical protein